MTQVWTPTSTVPSHCLGPRFMSTGTDAAASAEEKTEEEKAAIKAAREAKK